MPPSTPSLVRRLILLAAVWSTAVLAASAILLGLLFEQAALRRFDQGLSDLTDSLAAAAQPDRAGGVAVRDLGDLNAQARQWVMQEAGTRMHGTTCEQPLSLYALERPLLRRLPGVTPDLGTWHRVVLHRDCHVQHDRAFYSAPFTLVGKTLWLRATDTVVALYQDYRHLATHARAQRPGQRVTVSDHLPPEARHFFEEAARLDPENRALLRAREKFNP